VNGREGGEPLARIDGLVEDVANAIDTARRLVRTVNAVDLAPLEDDVRELTEMIAGAGLTKGDGTATRLSRSLRAVMEGLDRLEADLTLVSASRGARG
jgi:hypothetical protein